jgi:hypothetical protein
VTGHNYDGTRRDRNKDVRRNRAAVRGEPDPYTGAFIASHDCGSELIDEGFSFWCPRCQAAVSPAEVISGDRE